jgi:hypothetical protein
MIIINSEYWEKRVRVILFQESLNDHYPSLETYLNCKFRWIGFYPDERKIALTFKKEEDEVVFLLRWGNEKVSYNKKDRGDKKNT